MKKNLVSALLMMTMLVSAVVFTGCSAATKMLNRAIRPRKAR